MSGMFMHSPRHPGDEYLHVREHFHVHLVKSRVGGFGGDPGPLGCQFMARSTF